MRCRAILLIIIPLVAVGCEMGPKSGRGFTLPDGDAIAGKSTFQALKCHACHSVGDIEQLDPGEEDPNVKIALGGEVSRIQTYGELVTAIINPSHRFASGHSREEMQTEDGSSKMPVYNDTMTVTELTDLVAFLQSQYTLRPTPPTTYPAYY